MTAHQDEEINYKKLTFYVDAPTAKDYSDFLENLRKNILTGSTLDKYNLPILRSESEAQGKLYCYVDVSYNSKPLTLAFDVVNLNLTAFKFESNSYFFSNTKDNDLFTGTVKTTMKFSNTYPSLGNRAAVNLGKFALQNAVSILTSYNQHDESVIKTSIINVMGMVLEATKFKFIQDAVNKDINIDIPIDVVIISYEDKWTDLSEQIQHADADGDFLTSVVVKKYPDGNSDTITTIGEVRAKMGILKYYPPVQGN